MLKTFKFSFVSFWSWLAAPAAAPAEWPNKLVLVSSESQLMASLITTVHWISSLWLSLCVTCCLGFWSKNLSMKLHNFNQVSIVRVQKREHMLHCTLITKKGRIIHSHLFNIGQTVYWNSINNVYKQYWTSSDLHDSFWDTRLSPLGRRTLTHATC